VDGDETTFEVTKEAVHVPQPPVGAAAAEGDTVQDAEPDVEWDVGTLHVSGKHVNEQSAKDLSKLRCDFAYCICLRHLQVRASRIISRSGSPAEGRARSGNGM